MKQLIETLIRLNAENSHRVNIPHLSQWQANAEYRTIHLNYGRVTGKTSAMREMATDSDLIIVHDERTKRALKATTSGVKIITASDIKINVMPELATRVGYRYVWIDEPELCDLGNYAYGLTAELFILLGA